MKKISVELHYSIWRNSVYTYTQVVYPSPFWNHNTRECIWGTSGRSLRHRSSATFNLVSDHSDYKDKSASCVIQFTGPPSTPMKNKNTEDLVCHSNIFSKLIQNGWITGTPKGNEDAENPEDERHCHLWRELDGKDKVQYLKKMKMNILWNLNSITH